MPAARQETAVPLAAGRWYARTDHATDCDHHLEATNSSWAWIAAIASVYCGTAKLGLSMALVAEQVTAVWPPTGISLAVVLLLGHRAWPGIALGAFLANVTASETVLVACAIAAGNTLEAIAGAWFLQLAGFRRPLTRVRDVLALVALGAGLSTMLSATIGVLALCAGGVQPWSAWRSLWSVWWLGDATGALLIAPLVLSWATWRTLWPRQRLAEGLAVLSAVVLLSVVMFTRRDLMRSATSRWCTRCSRR
ncbi:MAG: MASE1 domain-containing protein [Planctomycetota bacterium]